MIIHRGNDLTNMENSISMWMIVFVDNAINGNEMSELVFEKSEEIWSRALEIQHDENLFSNLYYRFPNALIEVKMRQNNRSIGYG